MNNVYFFSPYALRRRSFKLHNFSLFHAFISGNVGSNVSNKAGEGSISNIWWHLSTLCAVLREIQPESVITAAFADELLPFTEGTKIAAFFLVVRWWWVVRKG